ncbi:MAG: GNAT family N-acetyltransferase [Oscillospiraceae bacterium]|nr:GNAT family N-acetyltransferase [Oscillospiraceae bacterium]
MEHLKFVRYDHRRHLEVLYAWMNAPEEQAMFLSHSTCNSLRDFEGWIQDRLKYFYHEFFVVELGDGQPIGIVYSYEQRMRDGHCKVAVYIAPQWRNGPGAMAALKMVDYLFCYYPFRRVFCDIYSYNAASLCATLQRGFEEVGRLKEYKYHDGSYHDLLILTITREQFRERWHKLLHPEV